MLTFLLAVHILQTSIIKYASSNETGVDKGKSWSVLSNSFYNILKKS